MKTSCPGKQDFVIKILWNEEGNHKKKLSVSLPN